MPIPAFSATIGSTSGGAYARTTAAISDSTIRIATGNRVIRSGDDSASLSSATRLQTQTSTLRSALVNGAKATSYLQVAYDGLSQIRAVLESLGELADTAANATTTPQQRAILNAQFQSQRSTIDTIVAATTFNGANLLDGSSPAPNYQLNDISTATLTLTLPTATAAALFPVAQSLTTGAGATTAVTATTTAQDTIDEALATVDAYQVVLDTAGARATGAVYSINQGIDALIGTDEAAETRALTRNQLQNQTAAALQAQVLGLNSSLLGLVR